MKQFVRRAIAHAVAKLPKGILTGQEHFALFERAGLHITPVHFYEPIPNTAELDELLWSKPSELPGITQNATEQISLFRTVCDAGYVSEFEQLPEMPRHPGEYGREAGFGGLDGAMLYAMTRHIRPKTVIEIGSGYSTLLTLQASNLNKTSPFRMVAIEPYPRPFLKNHPDIELLEKRVETVSLSTFDCLEENDFLFIDSSHTVKIGGDVIFEVLEILPRLKPGVYVHIHDIFLPQHYPKEWTLERRTFWTEQYLVQAFLCFNNAFEIVWSAGITESHYATELASRFSYFRPGSSSLWLRRL